MRVDNITVTHLPDGKQRLSGVVRYDDGNSEEYWFTAPADVKVSTSGNPWVAVLLPLAAVTGQNIEIDLPVDPWLLQNAECLLALWQVWHPGKTKQIRISATPGPIHERPIDVLSPFTAGVDAFFTVLRHPECKRYVNVLGLDMPLRNQAAYDRLLGRLSGAASELGATMIPMSTNVRETLWGQMPWESFSSGAALAGTFLVLEREFGTILIPSSYEYRTLFTADASRRKRRTWGTHPLSDPLYSTSRTQIIHEGMSHSRIQKTEFISNHEIVLKNLHVCFQGQDTHGQDDTNCCTCSKCYRTMIVLEILGKLEDCALFDHSKFDLEKIARLDTSSPLSEAIFTDIKTLALEHGRTDIAEQIDRSLRRSKWVAKFDGLQNMRLLWRVPSMLRQHAFRGIAILDRRA
jgi:hypothetical protein